jgi:hypothetical protein
MVGRPIHCRVRPVVQRSRNERGWVDHPFRCRRLDIVVVVAPPRGLRQVQGQAEELRRGVQEELVLLLPVRRERAGAAARVQTLTGAWGAQASGRGDGPGVGEEAAEGCPAAVIMPRLAAWVL